MVHKPISIMILPLFLALTGVLTLAVVNAIPSNNNHAFAEENNNTGFGQPQQQPPTNNTGFGQPQQQPPTNTTGFGQPQPQTTNNTGFGQQQPPTNTTGFGQPQQQQPPTNTTGFGQPQQQQPPTNTTGFGQPQQQQPPTNTTGFGQQQQPPPTNNTGFGQPPPANNTTSPSGSTANTTRPYNATLTGVSENLKNTNNETAADFAKNILAVHNRERAAVGVPPLVWNNTLAAHAKAWIEYLAAGKAGGKIVHCLQVPGWEQIEPCTHHEGENLAGLGSSDIKIKISTEELQHGWVDEKRGYNAKTNTCTPVPPKTSCTAGHYTQMVWNTTKEVGCATAISPNNVFLSCRYSPPGNFIGEKPY